MATLQDFVYQIKAARDCGKDIDLDDVLYGLECFCGHKGGHIGGGWDMVTVRMLDHWRQRTGRAATSTLESRMAVRTDV